MTRVRRLIPVLLACLALALGCTEEPAAPVWDNPLDPDAPTGGDPFEVQAVYSAGRVVVSWTEPVGPEVAGYQVLHSLESAGPFSVIATLEAGTTSHTDTEYAPNAPNYYKVRALDGDDAPSALSNVTAAAVLAPPGVDRGGITALAGRTLELQITAAAGDVAEVDSLAGFPDPVQVPLTDGAATLTWDVGPAAHPGERKHIRVRVLTGGVPGAATHDSVTIDFTPDLDFAGAPATLARRDAPLSVTPVDGVTQMRFALDRASLDAAAWLPAAETYAGWLLDAAPDSQLVFAEFTGELGLSHIDSVWAVPDALADLTLVLNGGSPTTAADAFSVSVDAAATDIRVAATPEDLAATAWQPYANPVTWTHDGCAGGVVERVWVQVRNDWVSADALTDSLTWLPPESLGLVFAGPDTVQAAAAVTLGGTATAGTCTDPLDGVFLDAGAGEAAVAGLADWTFAWTAPAAAETTTVAVAWRVTAGADEAAGSFDVVVVP